MTSKLATIPEIIKDAKDGKMFILVDDENRENEGDLVIPAEKCSDKEVNFMAKNGRGLICLALSEDRVKKLGLSLMSLNNESRNRTAFTVSIEAKEGISTGISAFDRAKTIKDAIDCDKGKESLVSPGHIFPLQAKDGGVLVRAGHTEAAVDVARLAGLNPSGVICEIMNDDGTMARMDDLVKFSKKHDIKIATIADLIEYRRKSEKLVTLIKVQEYNSRIAGSMNAFIYKSTIDGIEHIALVKGEVREDKEILVRMHHLDIINDCLDNADSNRADLINKSLKIISNHQNAVLVLIRNPAGSIADRFNGPDAQNKQLRNYGIGAQILVDLGVRNMILLTTSEKSVIGLEAYELKICGYKKI